MTEYLKILNMRTSPSAENSEQIYNLSEQLGFVHSHQGSPRLIDAMECRDDLL